MTSTRTAFLTMLTLILIPVIVNLVTTSDSDLRKLLEPIFVYDIQAKSWWIFLMTISFAFVANDLVYRRRKAVAALDAQIHFRDQTILTLKRKLDDAKQIRFLDVVTGISNEAKWKADIAQAAEESSEDNPIQVALIDLIGFGRLNDELGYQRVDEILRYLATSLDDSLRKNEGLYKRRLVDDAMLPDRLYRKYPGGDEFYIVAKGTEADMLGLLTRLQNEISTKIDRHISKQIAAKDIEIRFAGAICRLQRNESPDDLTTRLIEYFRRTRYPNAPSKLVWESGKKSTDFPPEDPLVDRYRRAETAFANSAATNIQPR